MKTKRNRPGSGSQAAPKSSTDFLNNSPNRRIEAPAADERAEAAFLADAYAHGYRLATKCLDCDHYLVNEKSVRLHRGPVCRSRAKAVAK